jgi:serine/threonine-protein kinase RsbW
MRSWPTENRYSDPPGAGAAPARQLYLWSQDDQLARRFLKETAPAPGRVRPLPGPPERDEIGRRYPALVFLAAADSGGLPWNELEALRRDEAVEIVLLLPRCPDRLWRRLRRMGFSEILSPPFDPADLDSLIAAPCRAAEPGRRLTDLERRLKTRVEFSLPADLKYVVPTADLLAQFARSHGYPQRVWAENLPLAAAEALTNAIQHGCGGDASLNVLVEVSIQQDVFRLRIEDPGPGFAIDALPDPISEPGLMRPDGRGLLLIRELMDRVQFEADGSVILLYVRRSGGSGGR